MVISSPVCQKDDMHKTGARILDSWLSLHLFAKKMICTRLVQLRPRNVSRTHKRLLSTSRPHVRSG
ncbi:hypothetical protein MPTK1_Vg00085 [Marchantia polymorpha subsp. ruderalis]|nr:hypothetical protein Mp_Vg00085 [Marchantia polymorpha subsp. ruderalis]